MTFPYEIRDAELRPEDLADPGSGFSAAVIDLLPYAEGPVTFLPVYDGEPDSGADMEPSWQKAAKRVIKSRQPFILPKMATLFLPVWNSNDLIGITVVEGLEKSLAGKLSSEWLLDRCRILSREFFLRKQLAVEPTTGLPGGRHFLEEMRFHLAEEPARFSLLLLESYPRARQADRALSYISRVGYFLNSCLGGLRVHHLGNGVFGLILPETGEEETRVLGKKLLRWLKREDFHRFHLGFVSAGDGREGAGSMTPHLVLDQAWRALRTARGRGPYALCSYRSISGQELHPLRGPSRKILAGLRKFWSEAGQFSLVLLSQDRSSRSGCSIKRACSLVGEKPGVLMLDEYEAYIYLHGADEKEALQWCGAYTKKLKSLGGSFFMGIGVFPCHDFKKSEIPLNARKAVKHTEFFGPGTFTVFDGVSLNISGDIYYGEGDLVRAVKEYQRGLTLAPASSNLMNSLGEAYAQMNRHKAALSSFKGALALEPENFMALYNLGATSLHLGRETEALAYFERAFPLNNKSLELILQLGRLYLRRGRHEEAVRFFNKYIRMNEKTNNDSMIGRKGVGPGMVCRYLGEAYKELGQHGPAIEQLQRALHSNSRDAASLSLLGELYALESQGDEIAFSLCQQAVELDDSRFAYWFRLAWLQFRIGDLAAALDAARESLRLYRKYGPSVYLLGKIYDKLGKTGRARRMYDKAAGLQSIAGLEARYR